MKKILATIVALAFILGSYSMSYCTTTEVWSNPTAEFFVGFAYVVITVALSALIIVTFIED